MRERWKHMNIVQIKCKPRRARWSHGI